MAVPPGDGLYVALSPSEYDNAAPCGSYLEVSQVIADPPLPGPLALRVKEGSSQYWLALLVMNTGNPLAAVQVRTPSGGWTDLARASFNYWIARSGAGPGPFTVRLTDTLGHQVGALAYWATQVVPPK